MSAFGTKRTFQLRPRMSAIGGKADMPTHFAYLKRITRPIGGSNRIRGTPESVRQKNAVCWRVRSSKAAFGRVKRNQIWLHRSHWLIEMTN